MARTGFKAQMYVEGQLCTLTQDFSFAVSRTEIPAKCSENRSWAMPLRTHGKPFWEPFRIFSRTRGNLVSVC